MSKNICPFLSAGGRKVKCIEHDCMMWTQVMGTHPQTGEQMNQWSCAVAWMPTLILNVAQEGRKTQAAIQHINNQLHVTFSTLAGRPLPALSGNSERDKEAVRKASGGS